MEKRYLQLLQEELVPALGCTEPIAIAYAAAKAREVLGECPDRIDAECSSNVIKNVGGVIVPMTGNMKGIEASAILGVVAGKADRKLEVLSAVTPEDVETTKALIAAKICRVLLAEKADNLFIKITVYKGHNFASVTIVHEHTNIVEVIRNNQELYRDTEVLLPQGSDADLSFMSLRGIYEFTTSVEAESLAAILDKQIQMNLKIAEEGLKNDYGAKVGKTLINNCGQQVECMAKAYASAGSDARMGGSVLPVVINSGSGNQGLTVSLPVIIYARELQLPREKLYRALALSNLISIYIKSKIGRLSAFCGAVSAACGSGAGIAFLYDENFEVISKTVVNTLANISGILCDGAKPSCALKIASAVDAAIMAYNLAKSGITFNPGDGLVKGNAEMTIASICRLAKEGMQETDKKILEIMIESTN
jgi:L-cysteine desulfidase